ncbi:glycoside hydrolase family 88 protein [Paenibacillus elgii]|uniref:glycoside hydrolase family 88 protein n=1 Tax=Paenibacillus elgii TaxID=189691 RepID=UPI000FD6BE8F|nr:glycoside hydrolase family 88 protein [Paenibacillus elgii]NEN85856.1 glucuronyl hydrolase [Paenibacillus elgii]
MKQVVDEGLKARHRYAEPPAARRDDWERAVQYVLAQIDRNLETFALQFPSPASEGNVYKPIGNTEWTSSFWTGMLWLAYEMTGHDRYRRAAEAQLDSYRERVERRIATETHDLGFLYSLSCVAAYKLTGNEQAKETALQAADLLIGRYFEKAGIIQAWGNLNQPNQRGRMIIDCLMNLPLLYWATETTGNPEYRRIAINHATQAAAHIIREDASSYHTFYMDVDTGQPRYGKTSQGFSDDSCWSRGQAWAIYGFPLSYSYTRDDSYLAIAQKTANFFLNRLPDDSVCYWDLIFTDGPEERDSSAAAIAACGLLELAKHLPLSNEYKRAYENAALGMLDSLARRYTTAGVPHSNGILLHAVYGKPLGNGIDECCIWGDYYYFEGLVRVLKDWKLYW